MNMFLRLQAVVAALLLVAVQPSPGQSLRGHGGPVRAIVIAPDGGAALTGSFDSSLIRWDLAAGAARQVLRGHDGGVIALADLGGGRQASAGEDGRIVVWREGEARPERAIAAHAAPVVALAVSPDGGTIASASWDGTARLTPLGGGEPVILTGHEGNVNGVAFLPDSRVVTGGYDGTLRFWTKVGLPLRSIRTEAPVSALRVAAGGHVVVASADGKVRLLDGAGDIVSTVEVGPMPLIALAVSPDGDRIAAGGLRGSVAIIDRAGARVVSTLVGPGLPVWSLAFSPDGLELLSGGADRIVRRWNAVSGEHLGEVVPAPGADVMAGLSGERGAEVFRACAACHTVTRDGGNRAGPTLHGLFGRRIGTQPDYEFSPALRGMDIVWSKETVARLFEIGPNAYTPGTKMPEQVIARDEDRQALVEWLERVTR